jgi:two-component sensor histidine kinase
MQAIRVQNEVADAFASGQSRITNEYLLVRELAHRLNNEYASLIGFTSGIALRSSSAEVKAALSEVTNLLHNYAGVHRALQMPSYSTTIDASSYIRTLCLSIKRARLDRRGIELELAESPLELHSEQCWKLGMIVSELITNSVRHAFGDRGGKIRIELSSFGPFAQCSFMDNGSSKYSSTPGQGLKIVDALASELNGEIVHRFGIEGATSILIFPIAGKTLQVENPRQINAGGSVYASAEPAAGSSTNLHAGTNDSN